MALRVNTADVAAEEHHHVTVWRCVRRDGPEGVGVGVAAFKPPRHGWDPRSEWEAHDVPEVHYVISGQGILLEEEDEILLRPGDAVVTMPGIRHSLWATSGDPLVTVYVAIEPRPAQPGLPARGAR